MDMKIYYLKHIMPAVSPRKYQYFFKCALGIFRPFISMFRPKLFMGLSTILLAL